MKQATAKNILEVNKKTYDKIAEKFSETRRFLWKDFNIFKPYIREQQRVLDIGCGNGRLLELFDFEVDYTGIDFSENLLKIAKQKYPYAKFFNKDILNLDFKQKFDIIFLISVLNHFPKVYHQQIMKQIYKNLRKGGYLFMINWNLWNLDFKAKNVWKCFFYKFTDNKFAKFDFFDKVNIKNVLTFWEKDFAQPLYYYAFTKSEIKCLLKKVGFKIVYNEYSNKFWWRKGNIITIAKK